MADVIEFQPRSRDGKRTSRGKGAKVIPWRNAKAERNAAADDAALKKVIEPPLKGAED